MSLPVASRPFVYGPLRHIQTPYTYETSPYITSIELYIRCSPGWRQLYPERLSMGTYNTLSASYGMKTNGLFDKISVFPLVRKYVIGKLSNKPRRDHS